MDDDGRVWPVVVPQIVPQCTMDGHRAILIWTCRTNRLIDPDTDVLISSVQWRRRPWDGTDGSAYLSVRPGLSLALSTYLYTPSLRLLSACPPQATTPPGPPEEGAKLGACIVSLAHSS